MKAAVWYGRKDVRIEEVPEPQVRPGCVKIKISWCGICGSDLHEYVSGPVAIPVEKPHPLTGHVAPTILGHELSGVVTEVGEGVKNLKVGDRVVTEATVACLECPACKAGRYNICDKLAIHGIHDDGGGLCEYTVFPEQFTHKIPDELSLERACLVEPISCGFHAMVNGGFQPGMVAVVMGAGPIGLGVIESLKASGARMIIAVVRKSVRQQYAIRSGADVLLDPTECDVGAEVYRLTGGRGADIAFETFGADVGIELGFKSLRYNGMLVVISLWEKPPTIEMMNVVMAEKRMTGSSIYLGNDFDTVIQMLTDGRIPANGYITKRITLDDVVTEGFETLAGPEKKQHVKIIVTPDASLL